MPSIDRYIPLILTCPDLSCPDCPVLIVAVAVVYLSYPFRRSGQATFPIYLSCPVLFCSDKK